MAATDVLTLGEAKLALGIAGSDESDDTDIEVYVTAVSDRLDVLVGPVVERTVSNELHDGGRVAVHLKYWPVASVTSASEFTNTTEQALAAETNSTKTANDYLLDGERGVLRRRASNRDWRFPTGRRNVKVTYVAGRYDDTASVASRYKQAASLMLKHLWAREEGLGSAEFGPVLQPGVTAFGTPTFVVPRAVKELLADQLQREL